VAAAIFFVWRIFVIEQFEPSEELDHWAPDPHPFRWQYLHPRTWGTWILLSIIFLIGRLPWNWAMGVGKAIGRLYHRLGGTRRRVTLRNLELCFPEMSLEDREALCLRAFECLGVAVIEPGLMWFSSSRRIDRHSRIEGLEHLESIMATGQGVLVSLIHNTCIEAGIRVFWDERLTLGGRIPAKLLYRPTNDPVFEFVSFHMRKRYANEAFIPRKEVRVLLNQLARGKVAAILQDQDFGKKNSIFVPFFGIQTATVPSTTDFATLSGSRVCMGLLYRDENNNYVVRIEPPLENFPTGDKVEDMTCYSHQETEHTGEDNQERLMLCE
jgi:KDO2-lipid IV(A) lauroyltransferase